MSQKTVEKPRTKVKPVTQRPPLWKVILLNDDFTPRDSSSRCSRPSSG